MEDVAYLTFKWIHIIAAGLIVGLVAAFPLLRKVAMDEREPQALRPALRFLKRSGDLLLIPAVVVLFLTGLGMSIPLFGEWNLLDRDGRWIILGMALWAVLAAIVGGFMVGVVKEMHSLVERGEARAPRMDALWTQYRWAVASGALVTLATLWVMVFQPSF